MKKHTICMYGAASDNIEKIYTDSARELGEKLAQANYNLIYGGGSKGLMGAFSNGVLSQGGQVTGVVPTFMNQFEDVNENCTKLIRTRTMCARKAIMEKIADAFIITPGGIGTFDEFFEILTLKELGRTSKPIIIFNFDHYYDDVLSMINQRIQRGFIPAFVSTLFQVCSTPEETLSTLDQILKK